MNRGLKVITHKDNWGVIVEGDVRQTLKDMKGLNARTCITSPPYYGLRDYGHEGQIGLEQTPAAYIEQMVQVFRLVKDCLSDDGTLWLNIGDSYASYRDGKATPDTSRGESLGTLVPKGLANNRKSASFSGSGIKHKDLIGIPWMLAFALRADGWYLRQDIIWHKPNPMPESVRDRCTKSHEYVFLLSKSEKYFFDAEAIKEPSIYFDKDKRAGKGNIRYEGKRTEGEPKANGQQSFVTINEKRNRRSVWSVATKPYKGAHFATFPPALIEPCVLAGSEPNDIVLDPFGGSGTTMGVALKHGRNSVICELNPSYVDLVEARVKGIIK